MRVSEIAAIAVGAAVVAYILSALQTYLRRAAKARALGCKAPVSMGWEPTGINGTIRGARAQYSKSFPPWVQERFDELQEKHGRVTGTIAIRAPLFRTVLMTVEPQNIQTILALKFKEFGFGPNRTENFKPLLGNGIVSSAPTIRLYLCDLNCSTWLPNLTHISDDWSAVLLVKCNNG